MTQDALTTNKQAPEPVLNRMHNLGMLCGTRGSSVSEMLLPEMLDVALQMQTFH